MHTVEIHGNALPVTAFNGVRVLTTERLAKVFGASTTQVINNYDRNVDRFEEGKHFFKVDGDDLRDLKNSISFRDAVGKNAKSLMLWTDRGASRHAKILDTDMAWDVYGELEEAYFANRATRQPMTVEDLVRNPEHLLAITQGYALQIADMRRDMTVMQADVETLHRITGSDDMFGVRETAKLVQMPQNRFVEWLKQNKWAYRQTGSNKLLAYSEKEKAGFCRNVAKSYRKDDGTEGVRETLKFYPKGVVAIAKKLNVTVTDAEMAAAREQ